MKESKEQLQRDVDIAFRKTFRELHNERINNELNFIKVVKKINNGYNNSILFNGNNSN